MLLLLPGNRHLIQQRGLSGSSRDEVYVGLIVGEGRVLTIENGFKSYVGARIGIHNLQGQKVGKVSRLRKKEYLYARLGQAHTCDLQKRRYNNRNGVSMLATMLLEEPEWQRLTDVDPAGFLGIESVP